MPTPPSLLEADAIATAPSPGRREPKRVRRVQQPLWEWALCLVAGILLAEWLLLPSAVAFYPTALIFGVSALGWRFWLLRRESPRLRRRIDWLEGKERLLAGTGVLAFACALHLHGSTCDPGRLLAAQLPPGGYSVNAEGIVIEEPAGKNMFRVRLESITMRGRPQPSGAKILVHWPTLSTGYMKRPMVDVENLPRYGDRIRIAGMLRPLPEPRNPGEFNSRKIRAREHIHSEIRLRFKEDATIIGHNEGSWLIARSQELRRWMEDALSRGIEQEEKVVSVLQSIVLGSRYDAPQEIYDLFRYTGTIHLFSVSGLHVAMVAGFAHFFFQVVGMPRRWLFLAILPVLWGYAFITGLAAATIRATVMGSIALIGVALHRMALPWNTLGAAAITILLFDTQQLFRPGFQLSFLLVAALLLGVSPLHRRLEKLSHPDPFLPPKLWTRGQRARVWYWRHFSAAASVSIVAWIASSPLTLLYFHLVSLSAIPANLMAGVLAWCILVLSLLSAGVALFSTSLSIIFNNTNWLFTKALLAGLSLFATLPGAHFSATAPGVSAVPPCEVTLLDLGAGAAISLRFNIDGQKSEWLIDCGSASAFRRTLLPYLRQHGVNTINGLFLTHGDSLHIGGAADLLSELRVLEVFDGPLKDRSLHRRKLHSLLSEAPTGKAILQRGDAITLAPGATLHILHPPTGETAAPLRTADDKALVCRLDLQFPAGKSGESRGVRLLFTSDAGFTTEEWLREQSPEGELQADILIKGRHSQDYSGTPRFLATVQPRLIIAAGAEFPITERVSEPWAEQLARHGIDLLPQEQCGAVTITFSSEGHWVAKGFLRGLVEGTSRKSRAK